MSSQPFDCNFYVYILTNPERTVLYIGVTNDMRRRLYEHHKSKGSANSFTGKYYCYNLVYYEHFNQIGFAIEREKQIKKYSRAKKNALIEAFNPDWKFLNDEF